MPDQKLCFVVSPIGAPGGPERLHADWLLKGIIEPVFADHFADYRVERADKINVPGMIDSQVINRLLEAELVIADMSLLNANAFYEMGIRHMAQRPIIHMYLEGGKIPFDVAPYRAIPFSFAHPDDLANAQGTLRSAVEEVLRPGFQVENPVTRARGVMKLHEHATPQDRVILDEIRALSARLAVLETPKRTENIAARATPAPRLHVGRRARDFILQLEPVGPEELGESRRAIADILRRAFPAVRFTHTETLREMRIHLDEPTSLQNMARLLAPVKQVSSIHSGEDDAW